jgi:hypothetical protein
MQKTIKIEMSERDGNAFAILGRFQNEAKRAGWSQDQVKEVMDKATSGDYDHLLQTFIGHRKVNVI